MPSANPGTDPNTNPELNQTTELDPNYDPDLDDNLQSDLGADADQGTEVQGAAYNESEGQNVPAFKNTRGFGNWRRRRPFAAGLFMLLSGIIMIVPAYLSFEVSNIVIQVSTISGVSTLLIGALLITSALMTWFKPDTRLLTGVASLILGIVALPMSNIGGFVLGTLCAVIGGALALSWTDEERAPKGVRKNGKGKNKGKKRKVDEQAA
ncbi:MULTISPECIES: DUF6114 domain-containing protein [unclassified Corynebacterium]|uniref:DUF6114 domain-containing protein n=1 Tax=unclassified Corynebacterium TaxID=2624378 RepID=UPI001EF184D2|nr:DUF6114 domain-containing protein [Corynebacterium sp. ACRPH]MCG7457158.1 DUF6114 domain-containing protein [Corynebacterium sp. ACRPH]